MRFNTIIAFAALAAAASTGCSGPANDQSGSSDEALGYPGFYYCAYNTSTITPEVWDGAAKYWGWGPIDSDGFGTFLATEPKIVARALPDQVWGSYVAVAAINVDTKRVVRIIWVHICDLERFTAVNPNAQAPTLYKTANGNCPPTAPTGSRCEPQKGAKRRSTASMQWGTIPSLAPPHVACVAQKTIDDAEAYYSSAVCPAF